MYKLSFVVLSILFGSLSVFADSWALPKKETVCSANKKFCFKVIPKKLTSQLEYFEDKVTGKENAGADKRVQKNRARGIFYRRDGNGRLRKRWEINLVNEVSPVSVIVSEKGDFVVTFDNWHSIGYGDDAVAIYETASGKLVRKFGLSDFLTESDIYELPASTSSIHWGGNHRIDKTKNHLVLQVSKGRRSFDKDFEFFEVRADLSTGKIFDEKQDRLPKLQFLIEPVADEETIGNSSTSEIDNACFEGKRSEKISSIDLLKKATAKEIANYPPAARAVRATGKVVVEILVATDGTVECARSMSGHPLLRATAVTTVKKWKFEIHPNPYSGVVVFEGTYALVAPDGTVIKEYR